MSEAKLRHIPLKIRHYKDDPLRIETVAVFLTDEEWQKYLKENGL